MIVSNYRRIAPIIMVDLVEKNLYLCRLPSCLLLGSAGAGAPVPMTAEQLKTFLLHQSFLFSIVNILSVAADTKSSSVY